jgi:hypothetical protein
MTLMMIGKCMTPVLAAIDRIDLRRRAGARDCAHGKHTGRLAQKLDRLCCALPTRRRAQRALCYMGRLDASMLVCMLAEFKACKTAPQYGVLRISRDCSEGFYFDFFSCHDPLPVGLFPFFLFSRK